VKSLLCCDVLDRIVDDAFRMSDQIRHRRWTGRGDDQSLRVLLTVTNLRGVPYSFKLFGGEKLYGMLNHGDFIGFVIGTDPWRDSGFIPVDVQRDGPERNLFKAAALATGAFPIGLKPRHQPESVSLAHLRARIEGRASKVLETIVTVDLSAIEDELKTAGSELAEESHERGAGLFTRIRQLVDDSGMMVEKKKRYLSGALLAWASRHYGVRVVTKKALDTISEALGDVKQAFRS